MDPIDVPLVGRAREAAALAALVRASRVVLVHGAAGVGKSTLVRAALAGSEPPLLVVSVAGAEEPRAVVARTARALGTRPPPIEDEAARDGALAVLLSAHPRTLVLDDVEDLALAPLLAQVAALPDDTARIVLVSRRAFTARETKLRANRFEVEPLSKADAVALVVAIERARGRTLAEEIAEASGGNPLLVRLSLAAPRTALADGQDVELVLRQEIEGLAEGTARSVLALLAAVGAPVDEAELARAVGGDAARAVETLRKRLVVTRRDDRLSLSPPVAAVVREMIGAPTAATWKLAAKIGERMLASSAHDDAGLIAAARARVELRDAKGALALVRAHPLARAAADPVALDRVLRDVAARDAKLRTAALLVLAREALRAGDYEAARRALDDLPRAKSYDDAERAALLRAECHMRAGEPAAAQSAIDALDAIAKRGEPSAALVLTRAQFAILRGELESAREKLEALAPQTRDVPPLEARRAVQMAGSFLYEERYEHTHAWVERARAATKGAGMPLEPVAAILDVHALLGLGEISRAEEIARREAAGRAHGPMLDVALLVVRGEHARALAAGDAALASLDRRADMLFRSVVARDLARGAMATGAFARAAKMLQIAEAGADEPGLAALRPICDAEQARFAEARGDRARARRAIDRAYSAIPRSPFVSVDRAALHGVVPSAHDRDPPIAHAYAALRAADVHVAAGRLDEAITSAERAERFYSDAGMAYEAARAELLLAEARARSGDGERALAACASLAAEGEYAIIRVSASLVRAFVVDRRGDVAGVAEAVAEATRAATAAGVLDASLARAARRLGIHEGPAPRADAAAPRPFEALVERLGLARPADILWRVGDQTFLRGRDEAPPTAVACTVDVDDRRVEVPGREALALPDQRIQLLAALADSGRAGATLEDLFARVWRGAFHPLRHRNAVYVALTRLKDALRPFARDLTLAHDGERYHLVGSAPVAVRRQVDPAAIRELVGLTNGSDRSR